MPDGYKGNKPDIAWWIGQIAKGKKFRKQYAHQDRWNDWRRWGRGEWRGGILPTNIYFKMVRTLVPRTYFRNPSVSISQTQPGMDEMMLAKLLERVDNKLLDVMKMKEQMKRAVLHGVMFGTGGLRRGYGAEFSPTPADIVTESPDVGGRKMREFVEYNDLVSANRPWCLTAHPGSIIVPEGCTDIHDARWVCFEYQRPKKDVLDDPRMSNKGGLNESVKTPSTGGNILPWGEKLQGDGVIQWEIRDKKTRTVFVIAPFSGATSHDEQKPLFFEDDELSRNGRSNYYPLIFNQDDEVFWGISDSQIIEPQQLEANQIRTQMMYHRRIMLTKFLYEKGAVTPDELSKLLSDQNVGAGVQVNNINAVRMLEAIAMPPGLEAAGAIVSQDVQEMLGLGVNQFGEYAPGSADRSATEANIVNQATSIRIDERRDTCADLLVDFTTDMNDDIAEYWTSDMVVDLVGPGGAPIWVQFHPRLLRTGQYNVKIDPDSSIPLTKQYREQKATQVYGALFGKNPDVNPHELTRFFLNELYGVDADSIMNNPVMQTSQQQPMQLQQVMQHLQNMPKPSNNNAAPLPPQAVGAQR
jgi:hypothetical protein